MSNDAAGTTYEPFARLLTSLRTRAGIGKQSELSRRLGISQQTVSRWERGLSRPRDKEIPLLATVLAADQEALFRAAGYARGAVAATFDVPFPVNALPPDSFERFCYYFLDRLYRDKGGHVHRAGGTGHRQDGIDISVVGPFGTHTFQCKRVEEFGPQKVRRAIAKHSVPAAQNFLLLSNIASPQSRAALAAHPAWQLWDREDISLRIRSLPKVDQHDLVDTFFRGKRLELLGEPEPGPWMTADQFFAPYLESARLFNHTWRLVGRTNEAAALQAAVDDNSVAVTLLVAPAGGGKTRLLRHVVGNIDVVNTGRRLWFLSPTEEVTSAHVEQLGPGKTLVIVDDAHDRDDLGVLFRHCALPENRTRLLLTLRPYGRERVKYQAASLSLSGSNVREIELARPSRGDAETLASEVLAKCNGPVYAAREIASVTSDSPLATVVGAQIVAREKIHPALLGNVDDFEIQILAAVQDVIAGEIVTGLDVERMQGLLRIVSLVQPILPDEPALLQILKNLEGIDEPHAVRLLRTLADAGVLFKRGLRWRLSPDLLADSIILRHCVNQDETSNGYVERLFAVAPSPYLGNLLINLGRLDWRRRNGRAEDSRLLEGVWRQLRWHDEYSNPHVDAAAAVAYYQPRMALRFARRLIEEGHGGNARVCEMLKNASYNLECVEEACELLWRASGNDERSLHQHPHHGIRILKELAEYEPNKPVEYMAKVVDFALALVDAPGALAKAHTPFVILEGTLAAEGHSTVAASRRAITLSGYAADRRVVAEARARVIDSLLSYIEQGQPRKAFLAARTLAEALRSPIGILGTQVSLEVREEWRKEHKRTLDRVGNLLTRAHVHPVVLVRAAESVAWHAFYDPENANGAQLVLSLLDRDLETRFIRALMDGWGNNTWPLDDRTSDEQAFQKHLLKLIADLNHTFDSPSALYGFVEKCVTQVSEVAKPDDGAPRVIVDFMIEAIPKLGAEILSRHGVDQTTGLGVHAGTALATLLRTPETPRESLRVLAETSSLGLRRVAEAYARFEPTGGYTEADLSLLRTMFRSDDAVVLQYAIRVARQVARGDKSLAVSLACSVDLVAAGRALHELFMWLSHRDTIPRECIGDEQWKQLLANLEPVDKLDDYWIRRFLKDALNVVPDDLLEFLKNRLQRATNEENSSYEPLTKPFKEEESLGLLSSPDRARHVRSLLVWALEHATDSATMHHFGRTVAALCGKYDRAFMDQLVQWMADGSERHAQVVAAVLREAHTEIIFDCHESVRSALTTAHVIGPEAVQRIASSLHIATTSGVRSTTPGEPFPEDVRLEKHASEVLSTLSRWDPAHELYAGLLRTAKSGIEWQRREKEAMDAEDEE
jgi:transcriptional regulator with XRE-family HTH domain